MMAKSGDAGTVTLTVPTEGVERKVGRDGTEFYLARLPEGTVVDGRDLSGALVCSPHARERAGMAGLTDMELPTGEPKVVKILEGRGEADRHERVEVDPTKLCDAVRGALQRTREVAMAEQALALLKSGARDEARGVLAALLGSDKVEGPLPPPEVAAPRTQETAIESHNPVLAYEAAGILPAHQLLCSVDTRSPTEVVPDRFAFVAFDDGHCVSRGYFNQLLEQARARAPQHAGALDEHSIAYVVRQLREPFARVRDRSVAQVNGIGVDFTDEVRAIPGATIVRHQGMGTARDVMDLGYVALAVDKAKLIGEKCAFLTQADALADWLQGRMESDVEFAFDRMGMANVSALLRSPDAAQLLVESGVRLENPETGERMGLDPVTGEVACDFLPQAHVEGEDETSLMSWHCIRVAMNVGWRIQPEDALALVRGADAGTVDLLEQARAAYLTDTWLTTRGRIEAIPTRERAEELLAHCEVTDLPTRGYSVRNECRGSQVALAGNARQASAPARVA